MLHRILPMLLTLGIAGAMTPARSAPVEYFVDATHGDDSAPGTIERPWKTLRASVPRLKPGDTLALRGGTFHESNVAIALQGTSDRPITIRNYSGESPIVDGGYREFREPGNDDWELVDPELDMYASRKTYPDPGILHGYFEFRNTLYKFVGYDDYADFAARSQHASPEAPFYVGQGVHWRKSDGRIYVRMTPSDVASDNGYSPPGLPEDPRKLRVLLFGNGAALRFEKESTHVRLEGLILQGGEPALEFAPDGAGHYTVARCRFLGGRFHVMLGANAHDVTFDGIVIDGAVPDWIAWLDVKDGRRPALHLEAPGIKTGSGVRNIEVRNSTFRRLFDGINANNGGAHLYFHDNLFEYIRDDCLQLGTHSHEVEFAYNRMLKVSKGPSFQGRGDSPRPGTKYFHHNVLDCSKLWLFARRNADGSLAKLPRAKYINDRGEVWARPVGSHGDRAKDPWKIYHNTVLFGQEVNGTGMGFEYMHGSLFDPAVPQEVYNNIIIQLSDYWVSAGARVADGSQVFDGNLYHRITSGATHPLFRQWSGSGGQRDFGSLEEFKASPLFTESKRHYTPGFENSGIVADPLLDGEYRPAQDGPAVTGAVPLPAHWPGTRGEKFRGAVAPAGPFTQAGAARLGFGTEFYVDASRGDDTAPGTIERPWRTLHASLPRLKPGNTLYLREGVFFEKEIPISVRGARDNPITIRNFPGESAVIDGGIREFREVGNDDWELVDPNLQLYASRKRYRAPIILHGYFEHQGVRYKLVGYDHYEDLTSRNQFAPDDMRRADVPIYVGPGAHWRTSDGRLYIRLVQSDLAHENGYALRDLPADPREVRVLLFGNSTVLLAKPESAHVQVEGLTVQGQEHALHFEFGGASHFSVRNCRFLGGRFHVYLGPYTHDVLFDRIEIDGGAPDWIAWLDVKVGRRPAQHLESPGIRITQDVHHVEVRNSTFRRLFDGINANDGGSHILIRGNLFEHIRDDCLQLGTHTHDVEFAHNRLIGISKGPGFQGRGNSARPGTKYFHHNVIDASKPWLFARRNAGGSIAKLERVKYIDDRGEVWARPISSHGGNRGIDPWKFYHNTILFGQELNGTGSGLEYMHGSFFDPEVPQEVYNNIIIQVADYCVSASARVADGSQVFDGNLYHRIPGAAIQPLFRGWRTGQDGGRDFDSLEEFKRSPLFAESRRFYRPGFENSGVVADPRLDGEYRPAQDGPAATGAVPLPAHWPGARRETFRGALLPRGAISRSDQRP